MDCNVTIITFGFSVDMGYGEKYWEGPDKDSWRDDPPP